MRGFDNRWMLITLKIALATDVQDQIAKEKR